MSQQQIPQPTAEDRAIDLAEMYDGPPVNGEWVYHRAVRMVIRRCHAAERYPPIREWVRR